MVRSLYIWNKLMSKRLDALGAHNVAIIGPSRGAQGKFAIADVVGSIRATFRNWW
jgi:hypothetical protein